MIAAVLAACVLYGCFIPWARNMDNLLKLEQERLDAE